MAAFGFPALPAGYEVWRVTVMSKDFIKKHIHFSDTFSDDPFRDKKSKELYSDIMAQIISESLFLFDDDYYSADIELVEYDITNIEYCIDLFPVVNASVDVYHNWIILHLFTMIAANNMTIMTGLLDLLNQPTNTTNAEITKKALAWGNSYDNMSMIGNYIRDCSVKKEIPVVAENNRIYAKWEADVFHQQKYSAYTYDILKLIFLHELGHWQYARFTKEMKHAYDKQVYDILQKYYSVEYISDNQKIFKAWVGEIIADYIALLVFTKNSRQESGSKQCTKQCYIAIGLYYGLIAMEELGSGLYKKKSYTHPPVKIRQEVAQKLYANFFSDILGIPYGIFIEKEIQEWYVIQLYFSIIIDEYWRKNNG